MICSLVNLDFLMSVSLMTDSPLKRGTIRGSGQNPTDAGKLLIYHSMVYHKYIIDVLVLEFENICYIIDIYVIAKEGAEHEM